MPEARLAGTVGGLEPATAGWFVVNARVAAWYSNEFGDACFFEKPEIPFDQVGFSIRLLWPGRSTWLYHAESAEEDFLVLSGEAVLLIDEQERPLRPWDFVHCPAGVVHAFVPAAKDPCVIVMVGARGIDHTYTRILGLPWLSATASLLTRRRPLPRRRWRRSPTGSRVRPAVHRSSPCFLPLSVLVHCPRLPPSASRTTPETVMTRITPEEISPSVRSRSRSRTSADGAECAP